MSDVSGNTVSIITPTFLRDDLLRETISSVLNQNYPNWQLLVIDDAISPATEELIRSCNDKRIVYMKRPENKKGAPACRDVGIANAMGKFLMFLDSDDLLSPVCLANRIKFFESYPKADFLVFNTAFFQNSIEDAHVLWNRFDERNDLERFLSGDVVWHTSGSFFKTESLVKNGITYDEEALSGQDLFFHLDVLLMNLAYQKINLVPDVFIRRNAAQSRISDEHADKDKVYNRIQLMKKMLDWPQIKNNKKYSLLWISTIFREYIQFINSGRVLGGYILSLDRKYLNNEEFKKTYHKIKLANLLNSVHPILYRVVRRFSPLLQAKAMSNNSLYRSQMNAEEIKEFKILLIHQSADRETRQIKL